MANKSRVYGNKTVYSVLLSKEGEKYRAGTEGKYTKVILFDFEFDEIVGIFQDEGALTAEIEYTVKFLGSPFYVPNRIPTNQYSKLKRYLEKQGITIINDSGVSKSSWSSKLIFKENDKQKRRIKVRKYKENGWQMY